jgi:UDP-3-O-[3-hydroxymyristoyl] glucosamine N-acyltransferase
MLEIGKNVQITAGVTILTHGFDWAVLKGCYGEVLGSRGKVTIGDNVFIGTNSTILKGVTIGNNVIIAACSVVTKDIPDNCVAVGSPARPVMSLEEYYEKRKAAQYDEAAELVREYRRAFGKDPSADDLSEFFWLFTDSAENLPESWKYQLRQAGNYEESIEKLKKNKKMFDSMQAFLDSVR